MTVEAGQSFTPEDAVEPDVEDHSLCEESTSSPVPTAEEPASSFFWKKGVLSLLPLYLIALQWILVFCSRLAL